MNDDSTKEVPETGCPTHLVVVGADLYAVHPFPASSEFVIGRGEDCAIAIPSWTVSRRHARMRVGVAVTVEDLGGTNGTFVNNQRLRQGMERRLERGDVLRLGEVGVLLQSMPPPSSSAAGEALDAEPVVMSESIRHVYRLADQVATSNVSVLITGPTGSGKEVLARRIHGRSPRARGPFIAINCGALSESLVEAELFGFDRGAFTSAVEPKPGLVEAASSGTLFLDEVAELPKSLQAKLLRVIEERHVRRLGSVTPRPTDVRFLSATNRNLEEEVATGRFREDLFFRLNGMRLELPPLRERLEDLEPLVAQILPSLARQMGRERPPEVTRAAFELLRRHPWPGNVRELRAVLNRVLIFTLGARIDVADVSRALAPEALRAPDRERPGALSQQLEDLELRNILDALARCSGNQTRAAQLLGVSRRTLLRRLDHYGLARPRKPPTRE